MRPIHQIHYISFVRASPSKTMREAVWDHHMDGCMILYTKYTPHSRKTPRIGRARISKIYGDNERGSRWQNISMTVICDSPDRLSLARFREKEAGRPNQISVLYNYQAHENKNNPSDSLYQFCSSVIVKDSARSSL